MILSAADILRSLGSSEIIRLAARLKIVDKRPALSGDEYLYVCVSRFPDIDEFEATWTIWIEGEGEEELVIEEIKRLLPNVKVLGGLVVTITTTDFLSDSTQRAPEPPKPVERGIGSEQLEDRFQELAEGIQDQMLLVNSGRPGQDGKDGRDGRDGAEGRPGKDLVATDTDLFDLNDAEQGIQMERGQVLTWDGAKWTNLYVRQSSTISGGGSGGSGSGNIKVQERAGAAGDPENPVENVNTLSFNTNNGFSITDLGEGEALVNLGSAFAPWHVEGQETLAPEGEEPVEFVAGDGISLVTDANADPKKLTIIATGGSDGGIPEAPLDGAYYVRKDGQWINMLTALNDLGVAFISGPDEIEYIEPE